MRRKLFIITVAVIFGIVTAYFSAVLMIISVLAVLMISYQKIDLKMSFMITVIISFAFGYLALIYVNQSIDSNYLNQYEGKQCCLSGRVTEIEKYGEEKYKICVNTEYGNILVSYYSSIENSTELYGEAISFSCIPEAPSKPGNPRVFDYNLYLKTQKIYFVTTIKKFSVQNESYFFLYKWKSFIIEKREKFIDDMKADETVEGFIRGVLFGDTNTLDENIYNDFKNNGTAHVLAVSGLHVGMLYGIYRMLYKKYKSPLLTVAFMLVLFIYGTATLWSVSVSRAVLLIVLMIVGQLSHRRYDLLTALATAALIVISLNPYIIMSSSFQMSFLAVSSMAFISPFIEKWVGKSFSVIIAVQFGLMPYMVYTFNIISPLGIVFNIPTVFLVSIVVPVGTATYMIYLLCNIRFEVLDAVLKGLGNMIIQLNSFFSQNGLFIIRMPSISMGMIVIIYGAIFFATSEYFFVYLKRKDYLKLIVPSALVIIVAISGVILGSSPFDRANLVFVDVGQGDCLHVKYGKTGDILIDGGGNTNYNVGEKTLMQYLLKNGVSNIDMALATHKHTDHYLGIRELQQCFPVKKVLTEGLAGQRIHVGEDSYIAILWPEKIDNSVDDENTNSMVFMIYYDNKKILVTGDITEEGELNLLEKYAGTDILKADILKVAHHGSKYSSSAAFIDAVSPSVAVISVGKNNYGHPSEEVIEKLQKKGIMVFRTDKCGAVGIIIRKGKVSVCTKKKQ